MELRKSEGFLSWERLSLTTARKPITARSTNSAAVMAHTAYEPRRAAVLPTGVVKGEVFWYASPFQCVSFQTSAIAETASHAMRNQYMATSTE